MDFAVLTCFFNRERYEMQEKRTDWTGSLGRSGRAHAVAVGVDPLLDGICCRVGCDRLTCSELVEEPKDFPKQELAQDSFAEALKSHQFNR